MKNVVSLCLLAALPVACAPCDLDAVAHTEDEKRAVFCIVLGEGGGIRGTWTGHTITGDGVVRVWEGRGARENEHEAGRLSADSLCALWDAAKALPPPPVADSGGSLVRLLRVTTGGEVWSTLWKPRLGAGTAPTAYQIFADRCASAIRRSMTPTNATTSFTK